MDALNVRRHIRARRDYCDEPEAAEFARAIQSASRRITSPLVRLETCMVLTSRLRRPPGEVEAGLDTFIAQAGISFVPLTDLTGRLAVEAFKRFGKGLGSRAQLNLADCMSYACAREHESPILFKGRDFRHTDLSPALPA